MSAERSRRIRELFLEASDLPSAGRSAWLRAECAGDPALLDEVQALLSFDESSSTMLDSPVIGPRAWLDDSPPEDSPPRLPAEIDGHAILRLLGEGGMGNVYLARQPPPLERTVALKVIKLGMDTREIVARFESERRTLARMSHSGIAQVYGAGVTETGQPYFVMEAIEGAPITEHCDRERLEIRARLELFVQVCDAVQHAHQKGIVHRDIKPTNVLVARESERAVAKVIDFGIAKATGSSTVDRSLLTEHGRIVGTPEYMSPEQAGIDGADVDTRTDIYSLGVLLYELLVGALPFDSRALRSRGWDSLLRTIREVDAPRPSARFRALDSDIRERIAATRRLSVESFSRRLRGDLEWILIRALEKDPSRRFATASEMAADVRRHLSGDPVLAVPPAPFYRIGRWVRRHRVIVTAVSAVVVILSLSLVVAIRAYVDAEAARKRSGDLLREREIALAARDVSLLGERSARRRSEALRVIAEARSLAAVRPEVALLLVLEGAKTQSGPAVDEATIEVLRHFVPYHEYRHGAMLTSVGFSPDGNVVACSSPEDRSTLVLDVRSLSLVRRLDGYASRIRFSPGGDRIVTGPGPGDVAIWDLASGEQTFRHRNVGALYDADFSVDGSSLAVASSQAQVRIFDPREGGGLRRRLRGHRERVYRARFSVDGSRVLTASSDGTVRVFDARSGEERFVFDFGARVNDARFGPHGRRFAAVAASGELAWFEDRPWMRTGGARVNGGELRSVDFSPDGERVVVASQGRTAVMVELVSGAQRILEGHLQAVEAARFSPGGETVGTASYDGTARIWRSSDGALLTALTGHTARVQDLAFSRDGALIATASFDGSLRIWDSAPVLDRWTLRHRAVVYSVGFSHDGRFVMSASRDGTAIFREIAAQEDRLVLRGEQRVYRAAVSPGGDRCVTTSSTGDAKLWTFPGGEPIRTLRSHRDVVIPLVFDEAGERVATGSADGVTGVFELKDGAPIAALDAGVRVECLAFGADGSMLVTGLADGRVIVWSLPDGERLAEIEAHPASRVSDLAILKSPDRLVSASHDETIGVWSLPSGAALRRLAAGSGAIRDLAVSEDGGRLLAATDHKVVLLWDTRSWEIQQRLEGHESEVASVAFSPDGRHAVSGSWDRSVRLWDLVGGSTLATFREHRDRVLSVAYSPDGAWVASASEDGTARIWPTSPAAHAERFRPRELTDAEREEFEIED